MKKLIFSVLAVLIMPAVLFAGFNFGLIKAARKTVDKVDEQVVIKKAEISAVPVNHNPSISSLSASPAAISTGAVSAITCLATDPDGDLLTYTWSAASGSISGTGSTVNWTAPALSSTYTITVTVSDSRGGSVQSSTNVVVARGINSPPVISSLVPNPARISTGTASAITCTASDADADTLTYTWSAASGTIVGTGSTINWTAPVSSGNYTISVTVSDSYGGSVQTSTNVAATNIPPAISSIVPTPISVSPGEVSTITCTASDVNGDALTYTWYAASGTISGTGSTIYWTAPASTSTYAVGVTVSDGHGGSVQASTNVLTTYWFAYTTTNSGLGGNYVRSIAMDGSGNKWFATGNTSGVSKFDGTNWTTYTTADGLASNSVTSIGIDDSSNKWFGTEGGGISKFDGASWTKYTSANVANGSLGSDYIAAVSVAHAGNKYFALGNSTSGKYAAFTGSWWNTYTPTVLNNNGVYTMVVDDSDNKWFGTNGGGVLKITGGISTSYTTADGLASNIVYSIAIDSSGNKWFGTSGGVSKFDGSTWTTYTTANSGLVDNKVISIAIDNSGNKWFGTFGTFGSGAGVSRFDGNSWTTYTTANSGLSNNRVDSMAIDASGNKWFGTYGGGVTKYTGN